MTFLSGGTLVTKTPQPTYALDSSFFPHMPPMSSPVWPSAYSAMYRQQLWVYTVVNKLAAGTARLPLPVYLKDDLNRPRADDHPMAALLSNPNPGMSRFTLWEWTSSTFDVFGEAFWYKKRQGGRVVGLYPLHPVAMTENEHDGWDFRNGKVELERIPDTDLVHFMHYNPDSTRRGLSPLEPLRQTLANEWHARNATSSFWQNGARPGVALSHPKQLSDGAAQRLKARWDEAAGGSGRTGSTVVLEEGMEPKVLTISAEEAQYIETRKLNREEVCGAYDVPPPAVHILDHATFSNITEQMRSVYRDTQAPRLRRFEATIETDLRAVEWPNDDVYAEFLMDEVLRGDFEARQDALAKASHMTIAEKRRVENLPFIDGTDRIFLNTATMPLDAIDAQARAITAAPVAPVPDEVALPVARSVMGRLSWQSTLDQVDPAVLTAGLSHADARAVSRVLDTVRATGGSVGDLKAALRGVAAKETKSADEQIKDVLAGYFRRQGAALRGGGAANTPQWNQALTEDLHGVAVRVATLVGRDVAKSLGFDADAYDVARTRAFLLAVSERLASNINDTTADELEEPDADRDAVFTKAQESRAPGIAVAVATMMSGFGATEAARQISERDDVDVVPQKTWVTGSNPRATHAAINGETVNIDSSFSNGMDWPGESGDVSETAGCNCTVQITMPGRD